MTRRMMATGVSEESEPYVIRVDKVAPGIPQITGIVDDEGRITGAITDIQARIGQHSVIEKRHQLSPWSSVGSFAASVR